MPQKKVNPHSPYTRLNEAIKADLAGQLDEEGSSPADQLITGLQRGAADRDAFAQAAIDSAVLTDRRPDGWWVVFERIIVLANLTSAPLGDALELTLQRSEIDDPLDRASAYSLLDVCGRPQTAQMLSQDVRLREGSPLLWLDLMLLRVPALEQGQALVMTAIASGHFGVEQFTQRLDEMRALGGPKLGSWLRKIRGALPAHEIEDFDRIATETFGLSELTEETRGSTTVDAHRSEISFRSIVEALARILSESEPETLRLPIEARGPQWRMRAHSVRRVRPIPNTTAPVRTNELNSALNIPRIQHTKQLAAANA